MLQQVGPLALSQSTATETHMDMLANQLLILLKNEHPCQIDQEDSEEYIDDTELAELDEMVISTCCDVVSAMAACVGPQFSTYCKQFMPLICKRYNQECPVSYRSMVIGSLAEICEGLGEGCSEFTDDLLNLFVAAVKDEDEEVKSNGVFAIGVLCLYSNKDLSPLNAKLLQLIHPLFTDTPSNLRDNACGCVSRMILKKSGVDLPLEEILKVLMGCLPLQHDIKETLTVVKALLLCLGHGNTYLSTQTLQLLTIFCTILRHSELKSEGELSGLLFGWIRSIKQSVDFPGILQVLSVEDQALVAAVEV
jgi:hypothetical protein